VEFRRSSIAAAGASLMSPEGTTPGRGPIAEWFENCFAGIERGLVDVKEMRS